MLDPECTVLETWRPWRCDWRVIPKRN